MAASVATCPDTAAASLRLLRRKAGQSQTVSGSCRESASASNREASAVSVFHFSKPVCPLRNKHNQHGQWLIHELQRHTRFARGPKHGGDGGVALDNPGLGGDVIVARPCRAAARAPASCIQRGQPYGMVGAVATKMAPTSEPSEFCDRAVCSVTLGSSHEPLARTPRQYRGESPSHAPAQGRKCR